jgi:hypothetical protein
VSERGDERPPVGPALERRLRDALARDEARRAPGEGAGAPPPEALLDALAGRLPEEERVRLIDQASRTAEGRRELATLRVALGAAEAAWPESAADERRSTDPASPDPASPATRRRAAWWLRPGTAAAAALLLATGLGGGMWWRMMHASPNAPAGADPMRAGPAEGAEPRLSLAPAAVATRAGAATTLAWRAVPGAVDYDVEVLTADGAVLHAARTRDTTLALPASALPAPGATARWWVRARAADGTTRRSPFGTISGR